MALSCFLGCPSPVWECQLLQLQSASCQCASCGGSQCWLRCLIRCHLERGSGGVAGFWLQPGSYLAFASAGEWMQARAPCFCLSFKFIFKNVLDKLFAFTSVYVNRNSYLNSISFIYLSELEKEIICSPRISKSWGLQPPLMGTGSGPGWSSSGLAASSDLELQGRMDDPSAWMALHLLGEAQKKLLDANHCGHLGSEDSHPLTHTLCHSLSLPVSVPFPL